MCCGCKGRLHTAAVFVALSLPPMKHEALVVKPLAQSSARGMVAGAQPQVLYLPSSQYRRRRRFCGCQDLRSCASITHIAIQYTHTLSVTVAERNSREPFHARMHTQGVVLLFFRLQRPVLGAALHSGPRCEHWERATRHEWPRALVRRLWSTAAAVAQHRLHLCHGCSQLGRTVYGVGSPFPRPQPALRNMPPEPSPFCQPTNVAA